jgi:hypothetical protein
MTLDPRLVPPVIVLVTALLLLVLTRRARRRKVTMRPVPGFEAVRDQIGRSVEEGTGVHVTLGRASLVGPASPVSLAALLAFGRLARDASASDVPPMATVGEGTLLLAAQDNLRGAYEAVDRAGDFRNTMTRFLPDADHPMAYAGGVNDLVNRSQLGSSLMLGRFGSELAIIAEAAQRRSLEQVTGSDDPEALAAAYPSADRLLIGEELLAAGAYLEGQPSQLASLQLQDLLRILVMGAIVASAVLGALR